MGTGKLSVQDPKIQIKRGKKKGLSVDGIAIRGDSIVIPREGLGRKAVKVFCVL